MPTVLLKQSLQKILCINVTWHVGACMPQDLHKPKFFENSKKVLFHFDMVGVTAHQPIVAHVLGTTIIDKEQHRKFNG